MLRPSVRLQVDHGARVVLAPVTAAAMLSGAILCATDVPPTISGASLAGYGLLAVALWLLRRLVAAR